MTDYQILQAFRRHSSSIVVKVPIKVVDKPLLDPNSNPDYDEVIDAYLQQGTKFNWNRNEYFGHMWMEIPPARIREFKLAHFVKILEVGGTTMVGYSPYIKVPEGNINLPVSEGLSNRTYNVIIDNTDPENPVIETRTHTWATWRDVNHPLPPALAVVDAQGNPTGEVNYYFCTPFGKGLSGEDVLIIHQSQTAFLIDREEIPVIETL